jgi:hypothetical protein
LTWTAERTHTSSKSKKVMADEQSKPITNDGGGQDGGDRDQASDAGTLPAEKTTPAPWLPSRVVSLARQP